jgi:hypothetical protein
LASVRRTSDPDGALWIAYFAPVGITRIEINRGNVRMRHFTTDDGLPSDVVYSQFFDAAAGTGWAPTAASPCSRAIDGYHTTPPTAWSGTTATRTRTSLRPTAPSGWEPAAASPGSHPAALPKTVLPETLITSVLRNDVPVQSTEFDSSTHSVVLRFTMLSYSGRR